MDRKLTVTELQRLSPDDLAKRSRVPLHFLLDNVRSGNNVGSVLRTADGFRLEAVTLCGITVAPPHRDILKTSLGAERTVPWQHEASSVEAVNALKREGYKVAIIEQTANALPMQAWKPRADEKWLVVLGNEVNGVSDELLPLADVCIEIPQFGNKHSFNVAVCGGMVAWHFMVACGLSFIDACELS